MASCAGCVGVCRIAGRMPPCLVWECRAIGAPLGEGRGGGKAAMATAAGAIDGGSSCGGSRRGLFVAATAIRRVTQDSRRINAGGGADGVATGTGRTGAGSLVVVVRHGVSTTGRFQDAIYVQGLVDEDVGVSRAGRIDI